MTGPKVLVSLLPGGVILLASYMVAGWYRDGIFVGWQALGSPPGGPGEIVTGYMEPDRGAAMSVILAASDGTYQRGALSACDAVDCWEPVTTFHKGSALDDVTIAPQCDSKYGFRLGSPPGNVVSCLTFSGIRYGPNLIQEGHVAQLEDGTYWAWRFIPAMGALMIMVAGVVIALIAVPLTYLVLRQKI